MYLIDKNNNKCIEISKKSFSELGFREREHLQEWFAKDPNMLGEKLLIIQKEFDGFSDTRERLDLLALDKEGNLVIIENKLDDSGKDVTWQALKYASYCSSLDKEEIRSIYQAYLSKQGLDEKADENLSEFFEIDYEELLLNQGTNQRIILVAANFRKEVTSTVLWLMNFNLSVKCIKVTPYQKGEELFLDVEQIIPVKDTEDYTIKIAEKANLENSTKVEVSNRHQIRLEFWRCLLDYINSRSELFSNISPKKDNYIVIGGGISGVNYGFCVTKEGLRVELYIGTSIKEKNKEIYDYLETKKQEIEGEIDKEVEWLKLEERDASRVLVITEGNYFDKESWDKVIPILVKNMISLYNATHKYLITYRAK